MSTPPSPTGGLAPSLFMLQCSKVTTILALFAIGCKDDGGPTDSVPLTDDSTVQTDDSTDDSTPTDDSGDADGDGSPTGLDCDDGDPAVYPGAPEVCGDGVVNDCDGDAASAAAQCHRVGALSAADADAQLQGAAQGDSVGWAVAGVGDTTGDGLADLLVGVPNLDDVDQDAGAAMLLSGAPAGLVSPTATLLGERANDYAGFSVAGVGDVDGDGLGELLVGAIWNNRGGRDAGAVYLFAGNPSGTPSLSDSIAILTGTTGADSAGYSVAGAGDFDGDGHPDLLVGAYTNDDAQSDAGAAYVMLTPVSGEVSLSESALEITGIASRDWAGYAVAGAGDTDGDGLSDVIVGVPNYDGTDTNAGGAFLCLGGTSGTITLTDADVRLPGLAYGDFAGTSVAGAGDVTGDGYADVLVGAPREDSAASSAGKVYLLAGPISGGLDQASASITGENADDYLGQAVAGLDFDGDESADLALSAPSFDNGGEDAGRVYVFYGPVTGELSASAAALTITGEDSDFLGWSIAGAGDTNGDGAGDLLVGAYRSDAAILDGGAAFLFLGGAY